MIPDHVEEMEEGVVPFEWTKECLICSRSWQAKWGTQVISPAATLHLAGPYPDAHTLCGRDATKDGWLWRI